MQKYGKYSTHPVENISANFIGEPTVQGTFGITATRRKAVTRGLSRTFGASVASFVRLNLWYNCLQEKPTVSLRVISRREIIPSGGSYTRGNFVALCSVPRSGTPKVFSPYDPSFKANLQFSLDLSLN